MINMLMQVFIFVIIICLLMTWIFWIGLWLANKASKINGEIKQ